MKLVCSQIVDRDPLDTLSFLVVMAGGLMVKGLSSWVIAVSPMLKAFLLVGHGG
jgi:hypothetical protein